jgi:transglutaminase-like putative cysteine protease
MALLRAVGIPCRIHGATIHKRLQRVSSPFYGLAPASILNSWAEVVVEGRWVALEGVILDRPYLAGLRAFLGDAEGPFLGFGVGTDDLAMPPIEWLGADTAIQMTGVNRDLGTFDDPDAFQDRHGRNLSGLRDWLYRRWGRHRMNRCVASIRACQWTSEVGEGEPGTPEHTGVRTTADADRGHHTAT